MITFKHILYNVLSLFCYKFVVTTNHVYELTILEANPFTNFAFVYGCRLQVGSITSANKNKKDFVSSITVTEAC